MNARPDSEAFLTKDQEVAGIEGALDALLTAALDADRAATRRAQERTDQPTIFRSFRLGAILDKTPAQLHAEEIVRSPVGEAARMAVRDLGKRLHEIGGMNLMIEVLDRVAERDPSSHGRRTAIMDHRWDGIGRTDKSAGWCA